MNPKILKAMVISLVVITVGGVVALILILNSSSQASGEPTIDELRDYSIETDEITTDLKDDRFVRIQFRIVTESKDAKEELEKRDFQLKNILIKELSPMDEKEFKTGVENLEAMIKTRLNELMTEGKVTEVYTIKKVLQ
ncbi:MULTISPECIES: flagellar basal body-associated protein FliL [Pontibacillus]|uniref:Flagellar protein FliL n=1 Tax=Pontibacillus chungwhensis TaxID=265426 RepID=A0ABY8V2E1_9BACI|nr:MULTISPECIES: flagellar basal body-associated protein FliL [Pontibacillus]MCD5322691.1 flagellar basal body-associated protein FliL [Pontibacillus sp. HN14]WIF99967.1 flagellar basal body-associated protein FliL [Pontibacillus chungwhensis]